MGVCGGLGYAVRIALVIVNRSTSIGDRLRRFHIVHLAAFILVITCLAFLRAFLLLRDYAGDGGDAVVRESVLWILGLFSLVVISLAVALWRWGVQVAAERGGSIQMRRLFSVMNQLQDGLIAVNRQGQVLGGNVRARTISSAPIEPGALLLKCFPFVNEADLAVLLDPEQPEEVVIRDNNPSYRLRSIPADNVIMIFISDVTAQQEEASTREREGQLGMIGRIAQGVAHDFNNILCAISAHAALVARTEKLSEPVSDSLSTISIEADRGAVLARQLVDLSQPVDTTGAPVPVTETVERAAVSLKSALLEGWDVRVDTQNHPGGSALPPSQLEQLLVRFGLQLSDEYEDPARLWLLVRPIVSGGGLQDVGEGTQTIVFLLVTASGDDADLADYQLDPAPPLSRDGGGVIQSIVLSMLERNGGNLDVLVNPAGFHGYRVCLAPAEVREDKEPSHASHDMPQLSGWKVLLIRPATLHLQSETLAMLEELGAETARANNIVAAYSRLEEGNRYRAIFIDESLLGMNAESNLRRILEYQPDVALVLIRNSGTPEYPLESEVAPLVRPINRYGMRLALQHAQQMARSRSSDGEIGPTH